MSYHAHDYNIIVGSGLFDGKYYLSTYEDIKVAGVDPVMHFCAYGWKEGRNPNPFFDTKYYMSQLNKRQINPLVHYIEIGHKIGYKTIEHYNEEILEKCAEVKDTGINPLYYYIHVKNKSGRRFNVDDPEKFGFNLCGHFDGCFGLAENARNVAIALDNIDIPHVCTNVVVPWHASNIHSQINFVITNPFNINFFAINWNEDLYDTFRLNDLDLREYRSGKINLALWASEVQAVMPTMVELSTDYEQIFTISRFCAESMSVGLNRDITLLDLPPPRLEPVEIDAARRIVGQKVNFIITKYTFVVSFIFDFHSCIERKNPYDVISVFEKALGDYTNTILILKIINDGYMEYQKDLERLRKQIEDSSVSHRIILATGHWSENEISALYSITNVYLSMHRSEGQGITLLQCLNQGIPVICTNYSGNTDFCHDFNSWLVDYHFVDISPNAKGYEFFSGKVKWAQPDVEQAAEYLKYIYLNYDDAKSKVMNSMDYIHKKYNHERLGYQLLASTIDYDTLTTKPKVVITCHVYNLDIFKEYIDYIKLLRTAFEIVLVINYVIEDYKTELSTLCEGFEFYLLSNDNYAADSSGLVNCIMYIKENDIRGDLYLNIHTKSNPQWRKLSIDDLLNVDKLQMAVKYYKRDPKLGLIGPKRTVSPLCNNRTTVVELMKLFELDVSKLDIYNDDDVSNIEDNFDYATYLEIYQDISLLSTAEEARQHWVSSGKMGRRIASRSQCERLSYSDYPLTINGNMIIYTQSIIDFMTIPKLQKLDQLLRTEPGKVFDLNNYTYTHAVERLLSLIADHLHLHILSFDNNKLKFHR